MLQCICSQVDQQVFSLHYLGRARLWCFSESCFCRNWTYYPLHLGYLPSPWRSQSGTNRWRNGSHLTSGYDSLRELSSTTRRTFPHTCSASANLAFSCNLAKLAWRRHLSVDLKKHFQPLASNMGSSHMRGYVGQSKPLELSRRISKYCLPKKLNFLSRTLQSNCPIHLLR